MRSMTNSRLFAIRINDEQRAALEEWCRQHQIELSTVLRDSALRAIGRPDLIGTTRPRGRPRGRPKSKPPAAPPKKRRSQRR